MKRIINHKKQAGFHPGYKVTGDSRQILKKNHGREYKPIFLDETVKPEYKFYELSCIYNVRKEKPLLPCLKTRASAAKLRKKMTKKQKQKAVDADYTAYTDGGCAFNPGGPGGYGVVLIDNKTGEEKEATQGFRSTTNNRMEVSALIAALSMVPSGSSVELVSDSQYAINCASGEWGQNKNRDLWAEYRKAAKGKRVYFRWVRGHSGNTYNERCDRMAAAAMSGCGLIEDTGYLEAKAEGAAFYRRAEAVEASAGKKEPFKVPDKYSSQEAEVMSVKSYASKYHVHDACARLIIDFTMSGVRSFAAYLKLKTGGMDEWSRKSTEKILETMTDGEEIWNVLLEAFADEKARVTALRWVARGLPLKDAVRKVEVDMEVGSNAIRSSGSR